MKRDYRRYRKIYEHCYGSIPEENGKTYHIHHIDGDCSNNHPANLEAKTPSRHASDHIQALSEELLIKRHEGSRKGGLTNVRTGHIRRIARLGGLAQGPKCKELLKRYNNERSIKVKVGNTVYESQTAAGKAYGIVASSVRSRVLSKNFPEWSYV